MGFRITTWNVNGIRNPFGYQPWRDQRTFQAMFEILEADIVVMQETKIQRKDLRDDIVLVPGWDVYFSLPRHKKGYSGVAIYTRNATCAPIRAEEGITGILCPPGSTGRYRDLPEDKRIGGYPRPGQLPNDIDELTLDSEGRCVLLEFPAFVLLGVYSPANRDSSRDAYRACFFSALDVRVRNLIAEGKQVILTGDLNVSRSELDSSNVLESLRKEGVSLDEWMSMPIRRIFNQLVFDGFVKGPRDEGRHEPVLWDLCRCYHPGRLGMNTCWDTKKNTRPANNGSRIDYILCSNGLKSWFTGADIQPGLMGSDHCPVFATLADTVTFKGRDVSLLSVLNPPTMFQDGTRTRDWHKGDLLPLSAKLMTEFDRRQNIRDMFKRANPTPSNTPLPTHTLDTTPDASTSTAEAAKSNNNNGAKGSKQSQALQGSSMQAALLHEPAGQDSRSCGSKPEDTSTTKRPSDSVLPSSQPRKRGKVSNPVGRSMQGQTTLQGFFKATPSTQPRTTDNSTLGLSQTTASTTVGQGKGPGAQQLNDTGPRTALDPSPEMIALNASPSEKVFDAVESKEQWSKLLRKPTVPLCEHDEPCISLTTKKPGVNRGRSFYICPRPLGPSGEKEKHSEWRCGTFIWSSDWNGPPTQ